MSQPTRTVCAAMSGGVDSSVVAYLLIEAGFSVFGATMKLYRPPVGSPAAQLCGSDQDIADARAVCDRLGIPHRVYDLGQRFRETVIQNFADEYQAGRTPNPCVLCNHALKFGALPEAACADGAEAVATGHYARVEQDGSGRYLLKCATDAGKDQSYVLWRLSQEQLSRARFPLGGMTKAAVRELADELGLVTAHKSDSQDICFVPDGDYASFLTGVLGLPDPPGEYVDETGRVLGQHAGILHYTIGQRKGLGIALGIPMFVGAKDPVTRRVLLTTDDRLYRKTVELTDVNLIAAERLDTPIRCRAKLRYRHLAAPATLRQTGENTALLVFDEPQRAPAAGQSAVFYEDDTVIGGGIIRDRRADLSPGKQHFLL